MSQDDYALACGVHRAYVGRAERAEANATLESVVRDVFPGTSVHDELRELVAAGLAPAEAIRTATSDAADFLGRTADFGSVAPGRVADLVLLEANPLTDIRNTTRIGAVMFRSEIFPRPALDSLLLGVAAAATRAVAASP
jgi:adenine deaminase